MGKIRYGARTPEELRNREVQATSVETWATNYVPSFTLLPSGTYYWNVVPVDSEGNLGAASPVSSFTYSWPSTTTPQVSCSLAR